MCCGARYVGRIGLIGVQVIQGPKVSSKYPRTARDLSDLRAACKEYVLPGYWPKQPLFKKTDPIWTMGSCFADNVREALIRHGVPCATAGVAERNNSPTLLRQFAEAFAKGQSDARDFIATSKCAIITLGVAASQFQDDGAFVCSNENVGKWRTLSVAEAQEDISASVASLRSVNQDLIILLTVSPVPLNRSPWRPGTVTADCISKSTLRVAVEQYLQTKPMGVGYWPAFEIVRWLGVHVPGMYAADDGLLRHVSNGVVDLVTGLFIEAYIA